MKMLLKNSQSIALCAIALGAMMSGCASVDLASHWKDRVVTLDGKNTEWNDAVWTINDKPVAIGVLNDDEYLYLAVMTSSMDYQRQIMRNGLAVWIDRDGGSAKNFGLRYAPLVRPTQPDRSSSENGMDEREPPPDNEAMRTNLAANFGVEILGPAAGEHHPPGADARGDIDVQAGWDEGVLVIEMKVPLSDAPQHRFSVRAHPGAKLGLGVELAEMHAPRERSESNALENLREQEPGSAGSPAEGMRGGGGRRGGGRGGRGPGGQRVEPLSIWAKITLAQHNASK